MKWLVLWVVLELTNCPPAEPIQDEYGRRTLNTTTTVACYQHIPQQRSFSTEDGAKYFMELGKKECGFECQNWEIKVIE